MCHFCHALLFEIKLHMPKTLNPLLSNLHAKTQRLYKRSAMRIAACRPHAWSANRPLMHSACPTRCATARNSHIASRWRHPFHRGRRQHAILVARCTVVPHTPRLRPLVHFGLVIAGIRNASQQQSPTQNAEVAGRFAKCPSPKSSLDRPQVRRNPVAKAVEAA